MTETFRCATLIAGCPAVMEALRRPEIVALIMQHLYSTHPDIKVEAETMTRCLAAIESTTDWAYYKEWSARRIDFLILTALEKEFTPTSKVFKAEVLPKIPGDSNRYESAELLTGAGLKYTVRLLCVGDQGAAHTAAVMTMALRSLNPRYVIMTGVAATVPGDARRLGHVLLATHLVDMSDRKVWPTRLELRHRTYSCDRELRLESQRFLRKSTKWRRLARSGAIISQTDLVKSAAHRNGLVTLLRGIEPALRPIGIEKEGTGVAISADIQSSDLKPGILMVKGAVDFANYHKSDGVQRSAARRSAQFLYDFLSSAPVGVPSFQPIQIPRVKGDRARDHVYRLFQELGDRRLLCHSHGTWEYPKAVDSLDRMRASITKALARLGPDWPHRRILEDTRAAFHDVATLMERQMQQVGWESVPPHALRESVERMRSIVRQNLQTLAKAYSLKLSGNLADAS